MLESLFNKVADLKTCHFIKKETPTQVLSCEYCEIFKNTFFYRTSPMTAYVEADGGILCYISVVLTEHLSESLYLLHSFKVLYSTKI